MSQSASLSVMPLPGAASAASGAWVHLCPSGSFSGAKGKHFTLDNPAAVIARSMSGGKIILDENHSTDLAAPRGRAAPARGWITRMEARPDGIWGFVDWTPSGRTLMAEKSYRGISPVIESVQGRVVRILRASLTNVPDLGLVTLHSQNTETSAMDIAQVCVALGLSDAATDDDLTRALSTARTSISLHSQVASAIGVEPSVSSDANALLAALRTRLGEQSKVAELERQVASMKADASKAAIMAQMEQASREGAVIDDAMRGNMVTLHAANAELATSIVKGLPRTALGTNVTMHSAAGAAGTADGLVDRLATTFGLKADDIRKEMGHGAQR